VNRRYQLRGYNISYLGHAIEKRKKQKKKKEEGKNAGIEL
jgi:hypothetical protein